MAALGPDFKQGFVDKAPISNADITPTLAKVLGIEMKSNGKLRGRVIDEALRGAAAPDVSPLKPVTGDAVENGTRTVLFLQEFGGQKYFHSVCMAAAKTLDPETCTKR